MGDFEIRNRRSLQAADEGRPSARPAETDVGRASENLPFRVFQGDHQLFLRRQVADGVPPREGNPQIPRLIEGDAVRESLLPEKIRPIDCRGGQRAVGGNGVPKDSPLDGFRQVEEFLFRIQGQSVGEADSPGQDTRFTFLQSFSSYGFLY